MKIRLYISLFILFLNGCSVMAQKGEERMILRGFGAKKACFADKSCIEKREPLRIPDLIVPMKELIE